MLKMPVKGCGMCSTFILSGMNNPTLFRRGQKEMLTVEGTVILDSNLEVNNLDKCLDMGFLTP